METMKLLVVLLLFGCAGFAEPAILHAQIQSAAFDPNCYQPQIGVDIDTIMGSYNGQMLGGGLINIGPSPDNPGGPGRLMMYGLPGTLGDSSAALLNVGPNFNYRNLDITTMLGFKPKNPIMGHFRSPKFMDMLLMGIGQPFNLPRIYWQQADGTFDSSEYTSLIPDTNKPGYLSYDFDFLNPAYHAYLSSDSVEDIIMLTPAFGNSVIADMFRGGSKLFQPGDTVLPDEQAFFDSLKNFPSSGYRTFQGDFRGTGREDLIILSVDTAESLRFYRNDTPFTLRGFVHQSKYDTLFNGPSVAWLRPGDWSVSNSVRMRNGSPESLVLTIDSAFLQGDWQELRFFQGGADFGTRQLLLDSSKVIHEPRFFDGGNFRMSGWGGSPRDCGDMTGSGDHVLCVGGGFGYDAEFYTFYALGNSFDEKVDMYIPETNVGGGVPDTATLDGDRLQDVVIGAPDLPWLTDNGMNFRGSLLFIHGTDKIPHTILSEVQEALLHPAPANDPFSVTETRNGTMLHIHPWHGIFSNSTAVLHDMLGRVVTTATESYPLTDWDIPIPAHPSGGYVLTVSSNGETFTYKFALLQ